MATKTSTTTTTTVPPITTTTTTTTSSVVVTSSAAPVTTATRTLPSTTTLSLTTVSATTDSSPAPTPGPAAPGPNWTLIGGIGGGIVAAILLIGAISFFTKASKESKRRKNPDSFDALYSASNGPVTAPRVQAVKVAPLADDNRRDNRSTPTGEPVYESYAMKPALGSIAPTIQSQQPTYIQPQQDQYPQQYQYNPSIAGYPNQQPAQYYQPQAYGQQQQYYQQQQQQPPVGVTADGQPDYTAQWQKYFAENPGAYEQYLAQQGAGGAAVVAVAGYEQYTGAPVDQQQQQQKSQSSSPAALNAADFETYEEFVEAQNAASLAAAEASSSTAAGPIQSSATLALHRAEEGGPAGSTPQELEFEERLRKKLEKEQPYIQSQQQHHQDDDVPAYNPHGSRQ
ncbi:UNVERIFIED_CONTAM: hypothetical protein HDU68_010532 [Siphonaria sp. JEL0065]|nr:hypothetical protein HDU68_010532 [Siphonaria sp. JEL0065]